MIDADHQMDDVSRAVADREVEGRLARVVTLAQTYDTDLDDLWEAVTKPERIARWFTPVTGELRLGGRYQLEGNAGGAITACDPPNSFDATWEFDGGVSWIEVRLAAVDASHTRLELAHLAHPEAHWEQFGPGAVGIGWDLGLLGLFLYLQSGDRPPEADDFATTPEGLRFMIASGQAWGRADAEGGEDPEVARVAADRTIAAYTEPPPDT